MDLLFSERPPRVPRIASEHNLSPMALRLLHTLEPGAELPMSQVAEQLFCDASNVTAMTDRLGERGLVERRDDPRDRRVKLIALTADGEALRTRIVDQLTAPPAQLEALSAADRRALRDLMRRAMAAG